MLFPTTLILALLATITPALSAPITEAPDSLVARSEEAPLEARDVDLGLSMDMERRDNELYEDLVARDAELYEDLMARDEDAYETLLARSPEPEPEIEDMERRGKLGFIVKIGKKIASAFHHSSNNNNNNNNNQNHHKRSKIGNKIKGFFKKIGNGIKKGVKAVAGLIMKRSDESVDGSLLRRGGAHVNEIEARNFELVTRSKAGNFFKKIGNGIKKAVKGVAKLIMRRSDDSSPLEARDFEESELEARSFDEPELDARSFEDELEVRSFEEEEN